MTPESNEELSVEDILSSIRSILLEGNAQPRKEEDDNQADSDVSVPAPVKAAAVDEDEEIFDLSAEMIVKPIPVEVMAEVPAPRPEPEKTSESGDASEELLKNFADIFAQKTLHEIDLGQPDMSREVNTWLNGNLKPIAEKVIREEIDKLRSAKK